MNSQRVYLNRFSKQHPAGESTRLSATQLLLLLVFATETVLFGTLLSAYVYERSIAGQSPYDQAGLLRLALPIANTLVLLASAAVMRGAVKAARAGRPAVLRGRLGITLGLGVLFVAGQIIEFTRSGMTPQGTALNGMYFALIGFHAAHVLAGVVVLALLLLRAVLGDFGPRRGGPVAAGSWFWNYVTAIWLVLFVALYLV